MRPGRVRAVTAAALLVAVALTGAGCGTSSAGAPVARAFLAAWSRLDLTAAATDTDNPAAARAALAATMSTLQVRGAGFSLGDVSGRTAGFRARLTLAGLGDWTYHGRLQLVHHTRWLVHWTSTDIHPQLLPGDQLTRTRSLPARASILDAAGAPLFTPQPVVTVGMEPARVRPHATGTVAALASVLGLDPAPLRAEVDRAPGLSFVPVITLRLAAYEAVKPRIYALPGVLFQRGVRELAPTPTFARALLGQVGPATADVLAAAGPAYQAGDDLGLYGLQLRFQRRLTGTPSGSVHVVDRTGRVLATLATFTGAAGQPVATTIDRTVQLAAEAALAGSGPPAALVAIRASTGAVVAVANRPGDSSEDRALVGEYPPGSTFKVVSTYALLQRGLTPQTTVPCPAQVDVGGRIFHNFEHEAPGPVPFATDFALSCNAAFVSLAARVSGADLVRAAGALGLGRPWQLPVAAFTGSTPVPAGPVDQAATMIGQGRVLVAPVDLALVAAAVDTGTWRPPTLVTQPAQPAGPPAAGLDPGVVATLRRLMRQVVTTGTAAGAGLPAGTFGKTGTAEFGTGSPPRTHAWFIGWRGDLAFAVLVEGGGVGGQVAAPLAARFLTALPAAG